MIWWIIAWKAVKDYFPVIIRGLWKHRDIVLLAALVVCIFMHCGPKKIEPTEPPPTKEIIREVPVIRYVTASDSLTKVIYDSVFALFADSVDIRIVRRDRIVIEHGDTIVITDSIEVEIPRCWNQYHKLLEKHTAVNSYIDTIYVVDTAKRALRRSKRDTTLVLYLTEDVQQNKIKLRALSLQDFRKVSSTNKRVRFYGGLVAGGNKGVATLGPSFLVAGNRFGGGYLYLVRLPDFEDSHNALLYYRIGK